MLRRSGPLACRHRAGALTLQRRARALPPVPSLAEHSQMENPTRLVPLEALLLDAMGDLKRCAAPADVGVAALAARH